MLQQQDRSEELQRRVRKARAKIIAHSVPLTHALLAKYPGEDLEQEAMVGLIRAVDTYDATKGAAFNTWVWIKAKGAILDTLRKDGRAVGTTPLDEEGADG